MHGRKRNGAAALAVLIVASLAVLYSLWTLYGAGSEAFVWSMVLFGAGLPVYFWMKRARS